MEEILNFTHNGVESEVLALIKPVINNFLWRNGSIDSIEESLEGLKWLLNVSEPFLARLSAGLERFNAAMKAVGDDCKSFMERIIVKPDFYE